MTEKTPDPCGSDSSTELGFLPRVPAPMFAVFDEFGAGADDRVMDYAAALVAAERERCALICDALAKQSSGINARLQYRSAATAIRGEQPTATQDVPPENRPDSWWRWHI